MPPDSPLQFANQSAVDAALAARTFVLFKHSLVCPVSDRGFGQYSQFTEAHPEVPTAWLDVIGQRPLSQHVAKTTGVTHQSPQVIVIRDGAVAWHASHFDIRAEKIAEALARPATN